MEKLFADIPEVEGFFLVTGWPQITDTRVFARLQDWDERTRSQQEIARELQPKLARIPGLLAFPNNPPSLGQRNSNAPIEFVIQTSGTYEDLDRYLAQMRDRLTDYPGMLNVDTDLDLNKPQLEVTVNRDKVADAGLQVETVGRTLETLLGGRQVTRFERGGEQYDVIVQMAGDDRTTPRDLSAIYVRSPNGAMIQLSNLLTVEENVAPRELNRFNQRRSGEIQGTVAPGYTIGQVLAHLETIAADILPDEVTVDYDGQAREYRLSGSSLYFVFVLALGFIYLVMAAQFESFVDPLIIMLTVPLSMTGALWRST